MKRIILFFAVCLGLSVSQTTFADNAETARAAQKRTPVVATVRATQSATRGDTQKNVRNQSRQLQQRTDARIQSGQQNVKPRTTTKSSVPATRVSTTARTTSNRTVNARKNESIINSKSTRTAALPVTRRTARTALDADKIADIKSKDYSKCKTVYFECMDEFCANKDTNLRRCACSSRIHEFDNIQNQLSDAEDRMSDFNQRLLIVGMEKEDAAAIHTATEGEIAFQTQDTSESEKLLKNITNALNNSNNSRINNNLAAISLSLGADTAWDNVDSMAGAATTSKSGIALYNAAQPICVEMAKEICSDEEMVVAQNSYKLTIQQDCDTVAKSYKTLYSQAQNKINESAALLDIARLNIYQQRNSDDILTCKKKILAQLSDPAVCGKNLYKCLDITGQYIDPSTGKAFLSTNLYKLTSLLQEPDDNFTWSNVRQNQSFVNFLNSKRTFLEPAIEQCQDISDTVWKDFLDDALGQIKLAQESKLEEIRQSCTTLIGECKTKALEDLSEFDSRALSTFNVLANKTADAMCANIEESCIAIMNEHDKTNMWKQGIEGITADITYASLIDTCTQIGRDCIVQQCNGTSGNFALCSRVTDVNRSKILQRDVCWDKVKECVAQAATLPEPEILSDRKMYYKNTYSGITDDRYNEIPTFCDDDDNACLITEQIWGNCTYNPTAYNITTDSGLVAIGGIYKPANEILIPSKGSTLMSWFANNTGTSTSADSCNANLCPINYTRRDDTCVNNEALQNSGTITVIANIDNGTNTCSSETIDAYGNCCATKALSNGICVPSSAYHATRFQTVQCDGSTEAKSSCPAGNNYYGYICPAGSTRRVAIYCISQSAEATPIKYQDDQSNHKYRNYVCGDGTASGFWLFIDEYGNYFTYDDYALQLTMSYNYNNGVCEYEYTSSCQWGWSGGSSCITEVPSVPTSNEFKISYED